MCGILSMCYYAKSSRMFSCELLSETTSVNMRGCIRLAVVMRGCVRLFEAVAVESVNKYVY